MEEYILVLLFFFSTIGIQTVFANEDSMFDKLTEFLFSDSVNEFIQSTPTANQTDSKVMVDDGKTQSELDKIPDGILTDDQVNQLVEK